MHCHFKTYRNSIQLDAGLFMKMTVLGIAHNEGTGNAGTVWIYSIFTITTWNSQINLAFWTYSDT